ncbi:2,3-bisphosphoglycerate-independent phosphoglycerate mutase [Enhygromyxa salina]|uniref:2,3-bisphosphoglycerate-independent phosphoglycerate mutase n=1 Tax=Enhygromyxa salina TaxID=215803 RepID=A0A2S9XB67_9BACT|nr:2,3-bisphosphoglycerate-independent phosphoglycerate mutase [Enhygromyxa salina]PRP90099.1 2,3-bisphosphoglycerate-independent phosphoglycerate mutase [Enhygromyxa salina]
MSAASRPTLAPDPTRVAPEGPVIFAVMDGVGVGRGDEGDAVTAALTPTLDWLRGLPSATTLAAHGTAVGMPSDKDMGNSEVGHNAIGAGRVFEQGAKLVAQSIASGALFRGEVWRWLIEGVHDSREPLHFIGLLSDGNVHSHIDHLLALLDRAAADAVPKVRVHILTDGRDVPGRSALRYIDTLEAALAKLREQGFDYQIASGGGRMHLTMDRYEADWAMVERGWDVHVRGRARKFASARAAVETLYAEHPELDDQHLPGFVIADQGGVGAPLGPIRDGASVVFFNFRGDRALEITRAFEDDSFTEFDRSPRPKVRYAGMMQYDGDLHLPKRFLTAPPAIDRSMGELLAGAGKRQLAIAETHKFGHVTYFWNGNRSAPFDPALERYIEVPSDAKPLEQRPWMKAAEVTDTLLQALREPGPGFDLVRLNYANGDMVGHTGELRSTILAVEAVDLCLARLVRATEQLGGVLIVTADHGNADQMFDGEGEARQVRTSHSLNPVPLAIYDPREPRLGPALSLPARPGLSNLAATTLSLLGFAAPDDYDPSLLA